MPGSAASALPGPTSDPIQAPAPCRLAGTSLLDVVPVLVTGDARPELQLAQRAIQRDLRGTPASEAPYAMVDVPGWKSEGGAAAMSLALPGAGQLYTGSKRGYLYLGVEAVALLSYATFQAKSETKRDEYHAYVGDPNEVESRFSFNRLGSEVSPEELNRLRTVYERNPAEFYQAVTLQSQYAGGWSDPDDRFDAQAISEDADTQRSRSRFGLYTAIANHLVSAVDALNLARFNNFALRENMTLKLKLRPGLRHGSYAFSVTQKF
ncbi:MAG: DUF5683 domain-containing protein [Candidatus Eisenbacteria bacterium]